MENTGRLGYLASAALLCLLLTWSVQSAPPHHTSGQPTATNARQPEPRAASPSPRTNKAQAAAIPFYGQTWFLVSAGVLLLVGLKLGATFVPTRESHITTGRMATDEEALSAYTHKWACGGYMLGRLLPSQRPLSPMLRFITALRRQRGQPLLGLPPEKRLSHLIMQAGPGAGKTTTLFIPQLVEDAHSSLFNVYLVDRKAPEIYQMVYKVYRDKGYRVIYFDPWRPELTSGFEPLFDATDEDIESMVQVFVTVSIDPDSDQTYYREQERHILRQLLRAAQAWGKCKGPAEGLHCKCLLNYEQHVVERCSNQKWDCGCRCRRHFCSLPAVADLLLHGWRATQAAINAVRPDLNANLTDLWSIQQGELGKLFTGLTVKLELFRQAGPKAAFSRRDFSISDVVPPLSRGNCIRRTILIVGAPQSRQSHAGLLASLMTQFVTQSVYLRRDELAASGCRWTDVVPVAVYLDEFGTYNIPGIDDFVATARSGAAGVISAVQSQDQLDQFYGNRGRSNSSVPRMLTNFRTKIYLKGCHYRVAADLSEQIGTKLVSDHIANSSRSAEPVSLLPRSFSRGEQTRPVEVPVITPDDIEFMPDNEAIVVGWTKPARIELIPFYNDPKIEPWVTQSQEEVGLRRQQNAECDAQELPRPGGEPVRLPEYDFEWSFVPGVMNAIARQDGADAPMAPEQRGKILAKLRDLGIKDVEGIALETCSKEFSRYTKYDATLLIKKLEMLEHQRGIVPPLARRRQA